MKVVIDPLHFLSSIPHNGGERKANSDAQFPFLSYDSE